MEQNPLPIIGIAVDRTVCIDRNKNRGKGQSFVRLPSSLYPKGATVKCILTAIQPILEPKNDQGMSYGLEKKSKQESVSKSVKSENAVLGQQNKDIVVGAGEKQESFKVYDINKLENAESLFYSQMSNQPTVKKTESKPQKKVREYVEEFEGE